MFNDDLPTPKKVLFTPANLDGLSVDELEEYIDALKAEIVKVQTNMKAKSDWKSQADALFNK